MANPSTLFGKAADREMKRAGIDQQKLAARLGVGQPTVSKTLNGNPTVSTLVEWAVAIGCQPMDLLTPESPPTQTREDELVDSLAGTARHLSARDIETLLFLAERLLQDASGPK